MKYLITLPIFFLSFSLWGNNPSYAADLIPDSLLKNANAVIRFQQKEYAISSPKEAVEKVKAVITIINEENSYDYLVVHYNKFRKVGKIKAKLYDKDGKEIRKIEKSEIIDHQAYDGFSIYSDARIKYVDLTYGVFPYTIEYEYSVTYNGSMGFTAWTPQQFNTSVELSSFKVGLPSNMSFKHKETHIGNKAATYEKENTQWHQWVIEQRPAVFKESYCPDDYQILPELIAVHEEFSINGYDGNLKDWDSYGQFMYELNKGRSQLSTGMATTVKQLTTAAQSDEEKVAILYKYLQDNMRYVSVQLGIGGWQTFDAQYVEKNKYGDCKALTYFMKAMLAAIDIPAYPALVYAGDQKKPVKEDFTIPYFNHVILKVPLSKPVWLECTSNDNPFGYLGSFTADRPVLVVTDKGGKLERTPPVSEARQVGKTVVVINEKGAATIQSTTKFMGIPHESFRRKAEYSSEEEQKKWFMKNQDLPAFSIEDLTFTASDSLAEATCGFAITVPRYSSKVGKRLFIPLNKVNKLGINLSKDKDRLHPFEIAQAIQEEDQITFQLPDNYTIESLSKPIEISTQFGSYSAKVVEQNAHSVTYTRKLTIPNQTIAADQYESLRLFFKNISKADKAKMVLVN